MITLILTRHGQTDWNVAHKLAGSSNDPTLTKTGRNQAKLLANKLESFNIDIVYSSRLKRAQQTARIISKTLDKQVTYLANLNERGWGIHQGKLWRPVINGVDRMPASKRYIYKPRGGESWQEFEARLLTVLETITKNDEDRTVLIVAHAGVVREMVRIIKNVPKEKHKSYSIENTSLTVFRLNGGKAEDELVNDIAHLA